MFTHKNNFESVRHTWLLRAGQGSLDSSDPTHGSELAQRFLTGVC